MILREMATSAQEQRLAQRVAKLEEALFGATERIATLEGENAGLRDENGKLREEIAHLQQQLAAARKNSSTSSKPPSSDMVKPPKPPAKGRKKRKRGGQPGHKQHLRPSFPPEDVTHFEFHTLDCCPECGGSLRLSKRPPDVLQQVEITAAPTVVTEHQGLAYWCPHC